MKKQMFRLALLIVTVCVLMCACAAEQEEYFDSEFLSSEGGIDLGGFELVYEFGSNSESSVIDENILGFVPNTNFADLAAQRLADVQKEYNCKIKVNYTDSFNSCRNFIAGSVGGVFICDVISGISDMWADAARTGMLIGMSELSDHIDYRDEDKWGPRSLLEVVYYDDDLYGILPFAWPELCHSSFGYPIVVNEDIVSSLAEVDPREYVENNTWTWEQFRKCLEAYTKIEGNETVHYGLSCHDAYFAEMYLRSNGSRLVKKDVSGRWVNGFTDDRAMKAMQEANDVYYGTLGYTINKSVSTTPDLVADAFVEGKVVMSANGTWYIYGQDARISQKVSNFGVLKWPVGPDVDPSYTFSIMENNNYCICFSALSKAPDSAAMIINSIYEPLPGYETFDDIKDYMEHSYFFDPRDCDTFFDMYLHQDYNYFHYGIRATIIEYLNDKTPISAVIERNEGKMQDYIDEDVVPSVSAIEALWGEYDR